MNINMQKEIFDKVFYEGKATLGGVRVYRSVVLFQEKGGFSDKNNLDILEHKYHVIGYGWDTISLKEDYHLIEWIEEYLLHQEAVFAHDNIIVGVI